MQTNVWGFLFGYANAQANTSIGTAYVYGDGEIPSWALIGEYDNGSAKGAGRSEFIWLPTEDGSAVPIGMFRNGKLFAIHSDHLGTPRLMTDEANKPVWQWPYSAFGNNKPSGILKAAPNPRAALTNVPELLKATSATEMTLRFPGQEEDLELAMRQNLHRIFRQGEGRYTQTDPIGLAGGLNPFAYVEGNPLSWTDPDGLRPQTARPSTREMARAGGTLPVFQPTMARNDNWRNLFETAGSLPSYSDRIPGANWPGVNTPVRYEPLIIPPAPGGNGCFIIKEPANQCTANGTGGGGRLYCGPVIGPRN